MEPPAGTVRFDGQDPSADTEIDTEALRKKRQIVVQDPYASMNARMTVRQIIAEPMTVQGVPTDEANAVSMIS